MKELHASSMATAAALVEKPSTAQQSTAALDTGKQVSLSTTVSPGSSDSSTTSDGTSRDSIEDVFVVVKTTTKGQVPDDELDELAAALLEATFQPVNVRSFQAHAKALEDANVELKERIRKLEKLLYEKQIKITYLKAP